MATASNGERVVRISKKRTLSIIVVLIVLGLIGFGTQGGGGVPNIFSLFKGLMDILMPIGVVLAVLSLIWGLATYIADAPQDPEANKRLGRKRMVMGIIIFLVASLLWVLAQFLGSMSYVQYGMIRSYNQEIPTSDMMAPRDESKPMPSIPPYYGGPSQPDITDTREFMKVSYSADIKTRDVRSMARNVKSVVREADGRVDSEQVDEKRAAFRFVLPQTKFESFRSAIEGLTYAKLYTENVSSENLLGQKQGIEQQTSSQAGYLADLQQQKQTLDTTHASKLAGYRKELASTLTQLAAVRAKLAAAETEQGRSLYRVQETSLMDRENTLRKNIENENRLYADESASLDSKIANAQANLTSLGEQDIQLLNNVATVSGYISITWVNLWQLAVAASPLHPVWLIIVILLILWYLGRRTRVLPRVEFV